MQFRVGGTNISVRCFLRIQWDGAGGQHCKVISEKKDMCPVVVEWRDVVCVGNVQCGGLDTALWDACQGYKGKRLLIPVTYVRLSVKEVRVDNFQSQWRKIKVMP